MSNLPTDGFVGKPRQGDVAQSIESLIKGLDKLEDAFRVLAIRLEPVLYGDACPAQSEVGPDRPVSDLARHISHQADRVNVFVWRIERLLDDLQIGDGGLS